MSQLIGDRYEIQHKLGAGGMGAVFRATDLRLKRDVALKTLNLVTDDEDMRFLFNREARSAAALQHPNIVQVFDYSGPEQVPPYLVMELIDGRDLQKVIGETDHLPEPVIVAVLLGLAAALRHAHGKGVIHRDLKPANIMVTTEGRVVLTDFGLAKAYRDAGRMGRTLVERATQLKGTPNYMAPEQVSKEESSPDSDVFAVGAIAYCLATGRSPFAASELVATMRKIIEVDYPPLNLARPELSDSLVALVHRCMKLETFDRPEAQEVLNACRTWLAERGHTDPEEILSNFVADQRLEPALPSTSEPGTGTDPDPEPWRRASATETARVAPPGRPSTPSTGTEQTVLVDATGLQPEPAPGRASRALGLASVFLLSALAAVAVVVVAARDKPTPPPSVTPVLVVEPAPAPRPAAPQPEPSVAPEPQAEIAPAPAPSENVELEPRIDRRPPRGKRVDRPRAKRRRPDEEPTDATPAKKAATLKIYVKPWGEVFLDGKLLGNTPTVHEVEASPGPHKIVVKHPVLGSSERVVHFGRQQSVHVDLR